jgi:capsular exopolysaccharide synthesis family protein
MANVDLVQPPLLSRDGFSLDNSEQDLIRLARLTELQIAKAHAYGAAHGVTFLEAAAATGVVTREFLMTALSKRYNYPIIEKDGQLATFSAELVVGHEPFGAAAEAIRTMRTSLVSSAVSQGTRAFVFIGAREGQGTTFLAANLAVAFAQMSVNTLLVDANLRDPRCAAMFGLEPNREGLADALLHKQLEHPPIVRDVLPGLSILPSGGVPPNPQELLCTGDFLALTANLSRNFGIVIYDSPSAMDFGDAYVLASRVGSAIIVGRQNKASFDDLKQVSDKLRANQCAIIGTIANAF